ncbi:hypothetical protein DKX38_005060 [Salix brachista]|uniref:Uncharacterized protein n=1 Tax=Salix brachista TaxID=2182728 RepID=A0A5N5NEZ5_9ROSI|nr:hypothetical protein DKX38_005060 [Salix brachista]
MPWIPNDTADRVSHAEEMENVPDSCISLDSAKARPLASISNLSARLKLDEVTKLLGLFALSTVGEHCWPNMIGTLGFTTEESQILEGYCDKATDSTTPSPSAPSMVPVKVVPKKTWAPLLEFEVSC